jgi:hypothetical protein
MRRELFEHVRAVGSEICLNYGTTDDGESLLLLSAHGLERGPGGRAGPCADRRLLGRPGGAPRREAGHREHSSARCPAALLKAAGVRCFAGYPLLAHGRTAVSRPRPDQPRVLPQR